MTIKAPTARIVPPRLATASGGVGKHYWTVPPLYCPPGASPALTSFISMVDAAMQTAVDLLGRGSTMPPPRMDDLLTETVYRDLGRGRASDAYERTVAAVRARQSALLTMDGQVLQVSTVMAAEKDQTLAAIKRIVAELNATLRAAGTGKLKSAQEIRLMHEIADALEAVYAKVGKVASDNAQMAGGASGDGKNTPGTKGSGPAATPGAPGAGSGGGSGGGDGGMGSIISALAMLPMAAIPLLSALPQLLQNDKDEEDDKEQREPENPGSPAPVPAPAEPGVPPAEPPAPQPPASDAPPPQEANGDKDEPKPNADA